MNTSSSHNPVRVCIVQPIVPQYRLAVFNLLSQSPAITLSVWSDPQSHPGHPAIATGHRAYTRYDAPLKSVGPFLSQPGAREAVTCGQFDVVILSWNTRLLQLGPALFAARQRGVRTILWGHGYSKNESRWRRWVRNRFITFADACLLYNQTAADRLREEGVPAKKVFVAPNAIDQSPIQQATRDWRERSNELAHFAATHDLDRGGVVLFISRLEADKKVDGLLEAFVNVLRDAPQSRLVIIGSGSQLESLKKLAKTLEIAHAVTFTGAIYDENELAMWFLSAEIFAYPVAIGLSILHAFGYGLPVVTSDDIDSHNPEIEALQPGYNGLLYRDGDTADFAGKILACLNQKKQTAEMGNNALKTVRGEDGYTLDRMVTGFRQAIEYVMASGNDRH